MSESRDELRVGESEQRKRAMVTLRWPTSEAHTWKPPHELVHSGASLKKSLGAGAKSSQRFVTLAFLVFTDGFNASPSARALHPGRVSSWSLPRELR